MNLGKYYAVLPLPHLSNLIKGALPRDFLEKRTQMQSSLQMLQDNFDEIKKNQKNVPKNSFIFSLDKKIISAIWITLSEEINNGNYLIYFKH